MEEQLISFETAKLAKEKGFNIPCYTTYNDSDEVLAWYPHESYYGYGFLSEAQDYYPSGEEELLAPTQSLLQKWLRDVYDMDIEIKRDRWHLKRKENVYNYQLIYKGEWYSSDDTDSYEKSLELALHQGLTLIDQPKS